MPIILSPLYVKYTSRIGQVKLPYSTELQYQDKYQFKVLDKIKYKGLKTERGDKGTIDQENPAEMLRYRVKR